MMVLSAVSSPLPSPSAPTEHGVMTSGGGNGTSQWGSDEGKMRDSERERRAIASTGDASVPRSRSKRRVSADMKSSSTGGGSKSAASISQRRREQKAAGSGGGMRKSSSASNLLSRAAMGSSEQGTDKKHDRKMDLGQENVLTKDAKKANRESNLRKNQDPVGVDRPVHGDHCRKAW
ncbi:expressed unknown protein [Seminavis robusta]|uniref:Uncharacterized protein n=1 Tax=Seminavis robusta TaxID=568900 RepID=A0A9N8DPY9_9STRA|nr:expressed unknown protein [Seminavis robusta]|eukprot:Sro202_g085360.1 n/a (177) ;mRNA; f:32168-32698